MTRRLLPLPLLALALLLPVSAAEAATAHFGTVAGGAQPVTPKAALHKAQAAVAGRGIADSTEVTPALKQLALSLPSLRGADRRRALRLLARPTPGEGSSQETEYDTPEHKPALCSAHFCVHWVTKTADAPPLADSNGNGIPDYVETMDAVFENVFQVENVDLGWQAPRSDGTAGCSPASTPDCAGKTDVYIKELGEQGIYGYAAPDPQQRSNHQAAYLVLDNDYNADQFPRYQGDPLQPMQVTAAHEYNHVLQFGYDTAQDTWMFESTATWMEDRVYTDVNDYLQYLTPWAQMTFVPLTQFNSSNSSDPTNVKVYGDTVWNRWLDTRYGPDTVRDAWAASLKSKPKSYAPGAYDIALRARKTSFFDAFSFFAAETAEWRASNSPFAEGASFPDVSRGPDRNGDPITLRADQGGAAGKLSHTAYILLDVAPDPALPQMKLAVDTPRGAKMAIALVGRVGDEAGGSSEEFIKLLPHGGPSTLTIDNPGRFSRLTAVVVNADAAATRYSRVLGDWLWEKDGQPINVRVSTDVVPPTLLGRSPKPGTRRVSTRSSVKVRFSERMFVLGARTVKLIGPGGHKVKATLKYTSGGRKATSAGGADQVRIVPRGRLRAGTRYKVQLSRDLRDRGGNALPASPSLRWAFVTKR